MNDTGCQNEQGAPGHVMIECLNQIILEYQNLEPPGGLLPRRVAIGSLPGKVSVVTGILTNRDSLLENLVFTALRRVTPEIFYHKTKTGREVDLVALLPSEPGQEQTILLVQVCASLSEAMVELAVAEGTIVTWCTDETIPVGFGTIQVMPVWRFLLEMEP